MNVCITRLPAGESVVSPRSHCRACGERVRWHDNLPVASFLLLRGRCRDCGARFSPLYAIVETLAAALAIALWHRLVAPAVDPAALARALPLWLLHFAFAGVLIVLSFIDLATYRIPNAITYPCIPIFTAASLLVGHERWWDGALGALAGYVSLRLVSDGYFWITGREGMGYGDAKLLALTGGFLGWRSLVPTVFLGSCVGAIVGIALALARRRAGDGEASIRLTRIPFGPFLALGALATFFFGDPFGWWLRVLLAE